MVQRSTGQGVVAFAADRAHARARVRLHDRRLDRMQAPLPAKRGTMPILSKVLLPDGAPACWHNREMLWNEVEAREHRRDANLAREVEFALPAELLPHKATALARDYMRMAFISEEMAADRRGSTIAPTQSAASRWSRRTRSATTPPTVLPAASRPSG